MIVDTIFSSDGVFSDPPGFLAKAVEVAHREGALFVADEVQPGFARTGEAMWGFERHGIVPDLVVMGKPMGNGLPIGGVVADPAVLIEFARVARYFNTFGGNPVCCAAALAVLEVIERESLMANALAVGTYLRNELEILAGKYPMIGNVRGAGLFIGVDIVKDAKTKEPWPEFALRTVNELRKRHILISASSPLGNVLKIRPPLPFSRQNAELFLDGLRDVFASMELARPVPSAAT
jgi:4-aminobutyrate aminotransferase-like enzyme